MKETPFDAKRPCKSKGRAPESWGRRPNLPPPAPCGLRGGEDEEEVEGGRRRRRVCVYVRLTEDWCRPSLTVAKLWYYTIAGVGVLLFIPEAEVHTDRVLEVVEGEEEAGEEDAKPLSSKLFL